MKLGGKVGVERPGGSAHSKEELVMQEAAEASRHIVERIATQARAEGQRG